MKAVVRMTFFIESFPFINAKNDEAECVYIYWDIIRTSLCNSLIHIGGRSHSWHHGFLLILHLNTTPKVTNFSLSSFSHKNILWFQVSVNYFLLVSISKSLSHIQNQRQTIYFSQFVILYVVSQITPLTVLKQDSEMPFVDHITFIEPDDIGMFQSFEIVDLPDDLFDIPHRVSIELLYREDLPLHRDYFVDRPKSSRSQLPLNFKLVFKVLGCEGSVVTTVLFQRHLCKQHTLK